MFFKSIELFGFKSFAERTKVDFEQGITAIIGPNGCGKTNIVDAVKWVFGAQSAKQLRGNRMEDVIFNGSQKRKPLGVSEVSLTFDNSQNMLPLNFQEVTVTRRLFRSGESEYLINKAACRLKDIAELFMDTGLGVDAYSLMEQNKIDFILNSKPEERRVIFEEAAGIMKYKTKKEESLRKLEQTKANLMRVSDIIGEIEKQINSLDYQVRKARQYQKSKDQIKSLEVKHMYVNYIDLEKKLEASKNILEDIADRLEVMNTHINMKDALISGKRLELQKKEEAIMKTQEQVFSLATKVNRAEDRIQLGIERKKELEEQIISLTEDIKDIRERVVKLDDNFEAIDKSIKELAVDIQKKEAAAGKKKEILDNTINKLETLKGGIRNSMEEFIAMKGGVTQINAQLENLKSEEKNFRLRRDRLCREEEIINQERQQTSVELKSKTEQLEKYNSRISQLNSRKDVLAGEVEKNTADEKLKNKFPEIYHTMLDLTRLVVEYDEVIENTMGYVKKAVAEVKALDDKFEERLQPVIQEKHAIEKKIVEGAREYERLSNELYITEKQIESGKVMITGMEAESISIEEQIKVIREEIMELKLSFTMLIERKSNLDAELGRSHEEKTSSEEAVIDKNKSIQDIKKRIKEIEKYDKESKQQIAGFYEEQNVINETLKKLQEEKEAALAELRTEEEALSALRKQLALTRSSSEQDRIKETEIKMQMEQAREKMSGDYGVSLEEVLASFNSQEMETLEKREEENELILKLKRHIDSMGPVNLAAPEEYAKLEERYKFLKSQEQDLVSASDDLHKVISKINSTSKENFEKTFNQVRENFRTVFKELFEGGNADLVLIDNENMLESGIDILAQPPGKKLQHISLLSGGEKALCAIALLFSVFMVKPSPFCILDEIDAPLDDSNLNRFKNMMKKFVPRTQFIMITHNKKTMEMANVLYGITMEEFGVSNIISVKLKKNAEKEETSEQASESAEETQAVPVASLEDGQN